MKKLTAALATVLLTATVTSSAFAVEPSENPYPSQVKHEDSKHRNCGLENFIKASLKKNNGDLNKVRADVAKHFDEKRALRESRLEKLAKEKGISVAELKAQRSKHFQEKLERKAKKQGLTITELKSKMASRHQQKLETMAKNLGISVEQLKQILPANSVNKG